MAQIPIGLQLYSVREDAQKDLPRRSARRGAHGLCGRGVRGLLWRTAQPNCAKCWMTWA